MRQTLVLLITSVVALPLFAAQRSHAVRPVPHILWIGVHPDDEIVIAPILGHRCTEQGAQCSLLVMTRGENGGSPSVRAAEMQRAASLFHASLTHWTFADVMSDVDATWSAAAGGHDALVRRIADQITATSPTVIYSFDPRHGTTCHPAHRALGALVIEAIGTLASAPPLVLVETAAMFETNAFAFQSAIALPVTIDASAHWTYVVQDAETHESQFSAEQVESLANTPDEQRRIYLMDAAAAAHALYIVSCP